MLSVYVCIYLGSMSYQILKNCNFGLTQVESSVVLDKIKSDHESKDSAVVEEDKNLVNSMAAIKI